METILLTKSEVERLLDINQLYKDLVEAFRYYSKRKERNGLRVRSSLKYDNSSAMILFPGLLANIPAFTIKNHTKFPSETPSIKGVIHLHDLYSGSLLSIMDSTYITSVRTGLSGAIGTHFLARKDANKVAIIGAGVQGTQQLRALSMLREISEIFIFDENKENAKRMISNLQQEIHSSFTICQSLDQSVVDADIIICATWSKKPFLFSNMIKKGTHITTLGPDEPNKAEVSAELIEKSLFICDDRELAVSMGAIGGVGLDVREIDAELGEVIDNKNLGRRNDDQITIFGMVGLPFQDLVGAWMVYQQAIKDEIGLRINFLQ
ncbi:ornithine cyclodeaminase family protein [Ornithinibacillus sp. BX22]|uniref:Ornithine cyclodeaminase family protein n=2 Tax=Ornithinibacillus TaxID=484508 RepID=A0A923L5Z3_9BACI|nr:MULTISPECIES: ornithine cyclodeaminase family protein [Ornithinibacillus]MBC5637000.1 ornithine cyclodeaminase family protein [Ornithinibacillus hominis]MBS3679790.1 ornithine cyclodeaminase family protein [Ornithinibacillus massiliensis]